MTTREDLSPTKRALAALAQAEAELDEVIRGPIAVVGMACRFPGSSDVDSFWAALRRGDDATGQIPDGRWDVDAYYAPPPQRPGKMYTTRGGFIEDVRGFDAAFFGISSREAAAMDPQQRVTLEVVWEALEHAGIPPTALGGSRTGVFFGVGGSDYDVLVRGAANMDAYVATGISRAVTAGRVSYLLDLRGPAVTVDTACSSSLVALHLACGALRAGECDVAVVGGVSLILAPEANVALSQMGALSPDGRCKPFDVAANGYGRSEGCGVVILKRLADATKAGDTIHAVVRGSAVNHDGKSNGLTAPSGRAQEAVLRDALANADLQPGDVSYVEAHGTGTPLGDPIELRALSAIYGRDRDAPLIVGSVKANVGHLEAAAGVCGFIKAALAVSRGEIPRQVHLHEPTKHFDWSSSRLDLPRATIPWPDGCPRRAAVSSFGFSGTNAHAILEAPPPDDRHPIVDDTTARHLLPISARSPKSLQRLAGRFRALLAGGASFRAVCAAASVGRAHHDQRLAIVARDAGDAVRQLDAYLTRADDASVATTERALGRAKKPVFVFSGQGSQWVGMGRALMESSPAARAKLVACDVLFREHLGWSVLEQICADAADARLHTPEVAQPAIFAVELALASWYAALGVTPGLVIGHSFAEIAAAHIAGALGLGDAVRLVAKRARITQRAAGLGKMATLELSVQEVLALSRELAPDLSIGAVLGPRLTVISGRTQSVEALLLVLRARGVEGRTVNIEYPSHSTLMDPFRDELAAAARDVTYGAAAVPMISTVTGRAMTRDDWCAAYWGDNLAQTIQLRSAIDAAIAAGHRVFIEVSPHPVLSFGIRQSLAEAGLAHEADVLAAMRRASDPELELMNSVAAVYCAGGEIDWAAGHPANARRASLPTYPWDHESLWLDEQRVARLRTGDHPLLGTRSDVAGSERITLWDLIVDESDDALAFLRDHVVDGATVMPGAAYVEQALAAARAVGFGSDPVVEDVAFHAMLRLPATPVEVQVQLRTSADGRRARFEVHGRDSATHGPWVLHASGVLRASNTDGARDRDEPIAATIDAIRAGLPEEYVGGTVYDALRARGLEYGPAFRGVQRLFRRDGEALGALGFTDGVTAATGGYVVHPALLDSALHVFGSAALAPTEAREAPYVPVSIASVATFGDAYRGGELWAHATATRLGDRVVGDVRVVGPEGQVVLVVRGITLQRLGTEGAGFEQWMFEPTWRSAPRKTGDVARRGEGLWLILADRGGFGRALADALNTAGARCLVVDASASGTDHHRSLSMDAPPPALFDHALAAVPSETTLCGVVHLLGLDIAADDVDAVAEAERVGSVAVTQLVRALGAVERQPQLWLVTRGVHADGPGGLAQSPLWGFGRSLSAERPELACKLVDVTDSSADVAALAAEILCPDAEDEISLREGERFVARLERRVPQTVARPTRRRSAVELVSVSPGILQALHWERAVRRPPRAGEVEIQVAAAGLNFLDVLRALGNVPGARSSGRVTFGAECAGTVVGVGEGVVDFAVGDEVIACAEDALRSFTTVAVSFVAHRPSTLDVRHAAALPIAHMTAHYALHHLGRLQKGDSVLIHSASGGTGLAAVQLAKHMGLRVLATAGSPEKRQFLRDLGIEHVMDSRTVAFADDIRNVTVGRGVDAVLNSLTGDAIRAGFDCLAPYGRFLEIGKRDIYEGGRLDLAPFRRNLSYYAIDLASMAIERPDRFGSLLREVVEISREHHLRPLAVRAFPPGEAPGAFYAMARAQHTGKLVVELSGAEEVASGGAAVLDCDATYLVTGGLGGIGLKLASWLIDRGAGHVVLVGRRPPSPATAAVIEQLQGRARVVVYTADVTSRAEVDRLIARIRQDMPPLRGLFHAAAVLDDAVVDNLTADRIRRVMAPKVDAAINLDAATADLELDYFVLFSSAASMFGAPGQASYAAANAFLDTLARRRRARGRPALSINWGPWAEVGLAAAPEQMARLRASGLRPLSPDDALAVLGLLLDSVAPQIGVVDVTPEMFSSMRSPRFTDLIMKDPRTGAPDASAEPRVGERVAELTARLLEDVSSMLRVVPSAIAIDAPVALDSLMALELRSRVQRAWGVSLPVSAVIRGVTIAAVARYVVADSLLRRVNDLSEAHVQSVLRQLLPDPGSTVGASARAELTLLLTRTVAEALQSSNGDTARDRTRSWLVPVRTCEAPRVRLFLMPYAGGAASVFRSWSSGLPDDVEVYSIEYPGHGTRKAESPLRSLKALADGIVDALQPLLDVPCALFGHSMGGAVALEAAARIAQREPPRLLRLFLSATPPPEALEWEPSWSDDRLKQLVGSLGFTPPEVLGNRELMEALLPTLRADFTLLREHRYGGRELPCRVVVFGGADDRLGAVDHWRSGITRSISTHVFPGGHFFAFEPAGERAVLEVIADELR